MVISAGLQGRNYWDDLRNRQNDYGFSSIEAGTAQVRSSAVKDSAQSRSVCRSLRSTAWLDGLRGFAALLVSTNRSRRAHSDRLN